MAGIPSLARQPWNPRVVCSPATPCCLCPERNRCGGLTIKPLARESGTRMITYEEAINKVKEILGEEFDRATTDYLIKLGAASKPVIKSRGQGKGKFGQYPDVFPYEVAIAHILKRHHDLRFTDVAKARKASTPFIKEDGKFPQRYTKEAMREYLESDSLSLLDSYRRAWMFYYGKLEHGIPIETPAEVVFGWSKDGNQYEPMVEVRTRDEDENVRNASVFHFAEPPKFLFGDDVSDDLDQDEAPGIFQSEVIETDQEREVRKQAGIEAARRRMEARHEREARNANPVD